MNPLDEQQFNSQTVYCIIYMKVKHKIYFQSASVSHHANFRMLHLIDLQLLVGFLTSEG
jgi:hypothetical protein